MRLKTGNPKTRILLLITVYSLIFSLIGCDAFVRKFTRKSKKDKQTQEELVLAPQEYVPPKISKEEKYRHYFLFWKSWHEELVNSLLYGLSNKKQLDCADEALKNLGELRTTLQPAKQKQMDVYIGQLKNLREEIAQDRFGAFLSTSRIKAERIMRNILRDFSYEEIKGSLT